MTAARKKLIEVALPLKAINEASAREKSIRHGHPSTLHLWWARRPLAACRAVLFASLVDDPESDPAYGRPDGSVDVERAAAKRSELFDLIEELVRWENSNNPRVINAARAEIARCVASRKIELGDLGKDTIIFGEKKGKKHTKGPVSGDGITAWEVLLMKAQPEVVNAFLAEHAPPVLDPFCGGGSIPLEAQRLGLRAYASDLNPVAVLITKALIEIPPKFAGRPPVNPEWQKSCGAGVPPAESGKKAGGTPAPQFKLTDPRTTPFVEPKSRGFLPHLYKEGGSYFVTFRLWDAVVPKEEREQAAGSAAPQKKQKTREEIAAESEPPRRLGSCMLANPTVAEMVQNSVKHFHGQRYYLHAWSVMGNHLHVVYTALGDHTPKDIHHSWKSYTAHQANKILKRTGTFWESEGFDHLIRSVEDLEWFIEYTENNPVAAGLCSCKEDWPWSNAGTGWNPAEVCGAGVPPAHSPNTTAPLLTAHSVCGPGVPPVEARKFEGSKKAGGTPAPQPQLTVWQGAAGLAEDVRYYGQWMRDEAEKRIGHLYPKVKITAAMAHDRPDLKQYVGQELTVIAWLWARTIQCPNPACRARTPLVRSFYLSKKKGKECYANPILDREAKTVRFEVAMKGEPPKHTTDRNGARCLFCETFVKKPQLRDISMEHGVAEMPMAIVGEGSNGRVYVPGDSLPKPQVVKPEVPFLEQPMTNDRRWFSPPLYGMPNFADLFTARQLVALTTFSDLVQEARERVLADARDAWPTFVVQASRLLSAAPPVTPEEGRRDACTTSPGDRPLADGGSGPTAYGDAVATYLAFAVDRAADYWSVLCSWHNSKELIRNTFGRQALPMVWDFAEANPFQSGTGAFGTDWTEKVPSAWFGTACGDVLQLDATAVLAEVALPVISTDPPYYDNIGYSDLSDYFYLWLRRSIGRVYPSLCATLLTPKSQELIASPYRHEGSKER